MTTKQTFPSVTLEALSNGLIRLEDETCIDGLVSIDLHPAQVQVLAHMVGFTLPDKTRKALGRAVGRLRALTAQARRLDELLNHALHEQDLDVAPEVTAAEFIAHNLRELLQDLEDLTAPDAEALPDAPANQGGQMLIPM